jgi:hypothetical protein
MIGNLGGRGEDYEFLRRLSFHPHMAKRLKKLLDELEEREKELHIMLACAESAQWDLEMALAEVQKSTQRSKQLLARNPN